MITNMRIIDAHVHFIDLARDEGVVWPSTDSTCYSTFLPADLVAEAEAGMLAGCILVETSARPSDNEWMLQLCEQEPLILGVVANLNPESEHFSDRLQRLLQRTGFVGLRIRPIDQFDLQSARLAENLQQLGIHQKTVELGATSIERLHQFTHLAKGMPDTLCILDHLGHPAISGANPNPQWLAAIKAFARNDNAICKVSGMLGFALDQPASLILEYYRPHLDALFDQFGQERLVFGSNWPTARAAGSYQAALILLEQFFESKNDEAVESFFSGNAQQVYRLK
jgi:predicted TIM-barrel fold metal-dependent hydrolase